MDTQELHDAQKPFVELAKKYKVDIDKVADEYGETKLAKILIKFDKRDALDESELSWLEKKAEYRLLATYYYLDFLTLPPVHDPLNFSLSKACKFLRKARLPEEVIEITNKAMVRGGENYGDSAVITSRGAAFRDMGKLADAKKCVDEAIRISPDSYHPYNLAGAIYFDEMNIKVGEEYFKKAIDLGSDTTFRDQVRKNYEERAQFEPKTTTFVSF